MCLCGSVGFYLAEFEVSNAGRCLTLLVHSCTWRGCSAAKKIWNFGVSFSQNCAYVATVT